MGVDIEIDFFFKGSDDERRELGYDLVRRTDPDFYYAHPCIVCDEDDISISHVQSWWRWWGPGYERGSWPHARSVLAVLLAWQDEGRIGTIWHYGDDRDREHVQPWSRTAQAEFDRHFTSGHWSYRWDHLHSNIAMSREADPPAPIDAYGHEMKRYGWGPGYAAFYSHATKERHEWRDGAWNTEVAS